MFFWYVGLSVVIVLLVFQSAGIDYRLVAVGSLLPLAVDLPARRLWFGHTLIASVVAGSTLPDAALLPAPGIVALEELAGLAAIAWVAHRCGLTDPARREELLRSGRLREVMRS